MAGATERVLAQFKGGDEVFKAGPLAEAAGCSKSRLNELARDGVLQKVAPGTYALPGVDAKVPEPKPKVQSTRTTGKKFEPVRDADDPRLVKGIEVGVRGEGRSRFTFIRVRPNAPDEFDCYGGDTSAGGVRTMRTFKLSRISGLYDGKARKIKTSPWKAQPGRHKAGRR